MVCYRCVKLPDWQTSPGGVVQLEHDSPGCVPAHCLAAYSALHGTETVLSAAPEGSGTQQARVLSLATKPEVRNRFPTLTELRR